MRSFKGSRGTVTRRELLTGGAALAVVAGLPKAAAGEEPKPAGSTNPDANAALWERFCDGLKPLARHMGAHATSDPLSRLEGIRALARITALGLDRFLEFGDARYPGFYELQTATRKYLGDNPDQTYRAAEIEGSGIYRVRGSLAGAAGVEIGVYAGTFQSGAASPDGGRRLVASLDERTLETKADGSFEVVLSPKISDASDGTPASNHLRLAPDANSLLIRTYFWDRRLRLAHAMPEIERLDIAGPPPPLTPERLLRGFMATTAFIDGSFEWWNGFQGMRPATNTLVEMPDDGSVQTPSVVRYYSGVIEIAEEQAFEIEFEPRNEPSYWSWVLTNAFGETPDWRYRPIVLNNRDVRREADGRVRIVIAHRDPGGVNWMDMAGHRELYLSLRWRGESPLPELKTRVVSVGDRG